ncbi:MAG TPA: hypothetical protein VMS43_12855 [Allosphingosinicella sp.]|nr:hypothetical protein [Allosphingosinicella sp.]
MDGSKLFGALVAALAVAGCGGGGANNAAAADSVNKAAPGNLASAAGNGAAADPSARPCPNRTRNWRAIVQAPLNPGTGPELSIEGEVEPDPEGRAVSFSQSGLHTRPPLIVVESSDDLPSDDMRSLDGSRTWVSNSVSMPDDPAYTRVEVRCGGTVLARLAIQRPR